MTYPSPDPAPWTALHGDTWASPWVVVRIDGQVVQLNQCSIRAEARHSPDDAEPTFAFTVAAGGIVFGTAVVRVGDEDLELPALQLRMRVPAWAGKPADWRGWLDIEVSSDASTDPAFRKTVIKGRRFIVEADYAHG